MNRKMGFDAVVLVDPRCSLVSGLPPDTELVTMIPNLVFAMRSAEGRNSSPYC